MLSGGLAFPDGDGVASHIADIFPRYAKGFYVIFQLISTSPQLLAFVFSHPILVGSPATAVFHICISKAGN